MLYLARRHLYFAADRWLSLPWWQMDVYTEGLLEEFATTPEPEPVDEMVPLESLGLSWG